MRGSELPIRATPLPCGARRQGNCACHADSARVPNSIIELHTSSVRRFSMQLSAISIEFARQHDYEKAFLINTNADRYRKITGV